MLPNLNNLLGILSSGLAIWVIAGGALACLIIDSLWSKKASVLVYAAGILSLLCALSLAWSQWQMPHLLKPQDLLGMDILTLFILCLIVFMALLTLLNALSYIKLNPSGLSAEFCPLMLFAIMGMVFLFASHHLLVNFLGLETMSLCLYVLVGSHKANFRSNEAALKYFIMGGVASAILLYGIALFYGAFGTVKIDVLAQMIPAPGLKYLPQLALALILTGLFFKLAVVPFHFWAPDVYEGAPAPVTGFMATAVKAATLGFALRIFFALDVFAFPHMQKFLTMIVIATLILANVMALVQDDVKRMLAYSSVSHAGFLLFGLLAGFKDGTFQSQDFPPVLFYLIGYCCMTLGAFSVLSLLVRDKREATHFSDLTGMGKTHPLLAITFTLFMLSLIGIPGTAGFAAKYGIIALAVKNGHIGLAITAIVMSVVSAFYYLRPSVVMFFTPAEQGQRLPHIPLTSAVSITVCAFLVLYIGLLPDAFIKLSEIVATPFLQ